MAHAAPEELLRRVEGKVWEWVVPSADLNGVKEAYRVSSTARRSDGVHVRVLTDEAPQGAQPVAATFGGRLSGCAVGASGESADGRGAGMRPARVLWHLVKADFLTRVRRTSFLLTLGFTVYVGYETFAGHIVLRLGEYRGVYNSAWVGALMGIVTSALLSLAGFYIVKGSILRDEQTRVGQILASTPMSKGFYTVAKWLGNFAVLASMVGVMAVAAV